MECLLRTSLQLTFHMILGQIVCFWTKNTSAPLSQLRVSIVHIVKLFIDTSVRHYTSVYHPAISIRTSLFFCLSPCSIDTYVIIRLFITLLYRYVRLYSSVYHPALSIRTFLYVCLSPCSIDTYVFIRLFITLLYRYLRFYTSVYYPPLSIRTSLYVCLSPCY